MNILEEVKVFCNQKNVTGALLIIGQWGCGKSHFIENVFMNDEDVKSRFAVVKLSLFGIQTREQFNLELKKQYIKVRFPKVDKQSEKKIVSSGLSFIKSLAKVSPVGEMVVSADWSVFVNVEDFNGNKILLIFDDLERCGMDMDILLGVLNEQIETLKHQTILIANEDFIVKKGEAKEDTYVTMKEKVVSRTINLIPNHKEVIHSIITNYNESCIGFLEFLLSNENKIEKVFLDSQTSNIRSLKCALQDFERFYQLVFLYIDDINIRVQLLINYLVLVFEYKKGKSLQEQVTEEPIWSNLFREYELKQKYRNFNGQYGNEAMKGWILEGLWNENLFIAELNEIMKRTKRRLPKEIILDYSDLMLLDDDILEKGFQPLLDDAYEGLLCLNDYISVFNMLISSKHFGIELPSEIDYKKLKSGIDTRITHLTTGRTCERVTVMSVISDESLKYLSDDARALIKHIEEFRKEAQYTTNRHIVLEALNTNNSKSVDEWINKYTGPFDEIYSDAVVKYFYNLENCKKRYFIIDLIESLDDRRLSSVTNINISLLGLKSLSEKIKGYNNNGKISNALNQQLYNQVLEVIKNYSLKKIEYEKN